MSPKNHTRATPSEQSELTALKRALSHSAIGSWTWDANGSMQWDANTTQLLGASPVGSKTSVTNFLFHLHDDDHLDILNALEATSLKNENLDLLVTVMSGKTVLRRLRLLGSPMNTNQSKASAITGICIEAASTETDIPLSKSSPLTSFFEKSKDMMAELDLSGNLIQANSAWAQFLHLHLSQLIGRSFLDFLHPDSLPNTKVWLSKLKKLQTHADKQPLANGELSARIYVQHHGNREIEWTWTADLITGRIFTISRDITESYTEETELTQDLAHAQRSNTELESFASTASHDLREPLRMISSYLNLLQEHYPEALDNRGRRYIDYANKGADRMRTLIDDLLAYARIGKTSAPHEAVALEDIIAHAVSNLSVAIRKSEAELTIAINDAPVVWGAPISLTRLFQNLLSNAIKFQTTDKAPSVHVSFKDGAAQGSPDKYIVAVKDNGIGIDPDHKDILFNLFQRLNTRDEYNGSGIGLSVCKKIVEQHGGDIWVNSTPQLGSTFYVSLKKANSEKMNSI